MQGLGLSLDPKVGALGNFRKSKKSKKSKCKKLSEALLQALHTLQH